MKKIIYCPLCLKRGKKKIIGKVSEDTTGVLYLWCKSDKQEVRIELDDINKSLDEPIEFTKEVKQ